MTNHRSISRAAMGHFPPCSRADFDDFPGVGPRRKIFVEIRLTPSKSRSYNARLRGARGLRSRAYALGRIIMLLAVTSRIPRKRTGRKLRLRCLVWRVNPLALFDIVDRKKEKRRRRVSWRFMGQPMDNRNTVVLRFEKPKSRWKRRE
jgi:hypothetical protein